MVLPALRRSRVDLFPQTNGNARKSCGNEGGCEGVSLNNGRSPWGGSSWIKDDSIRCWTWKPLRKLEVWSAINSLLPNKLSTATILFGAFNKWAYPSRTRNKWEHGGTPRAIATKLRGESTINRLSKEIAHGEVREGAYFLLMQTLPCVLHMENRNGIKLLTMLFIEGLSNVKKKPLYTDVNAEGARLLRYIADMERIINRSILGSDDDPCQWMCPYDGIKRNFGPLQWTVCEHVVSLIPSIS